MIRGLTPASWQLHDHRHITLNVELGHCSELCTNKAMASPVSTSANIAIPVTCTGKYNNEFPLNANAYSSSVISLEGPVSFLADGHR